MSKIRINSLTFSNGSTVNLADVTVIVGPNNTGKIYVIERLRVYRSELYLYGTALDSLLLSNDPYPIALHEARDRDCRYVLRKLMAINRAIRGLGDDRR